jgi:hypothetical protein
MYITSVWFRSLGLGDIVLVTALALAVVVFAVWCVAHGVRGWRLALYTAAAGYVAALVVLEFCPLPSLTPPPPLKLPAWAPQEPPEPVTIHWDPDLALPGRYWFDIENQQLMNIVMMLPFGVFLRTLTRWRGWLLATVCVAVPVAIELSHYLISMAVGYSWRAAQLTDVIHKSAGALLGVGLVSLVLLAGTRLRLPRLLRA